MSKHVKNIFTVALAVSCSSRLNQTSFSQLVKSYVFSLFDERARKSHFHVQGFAPETRFGTEVKAARKWCISYLLQFYCSQMATRHISADNFRLDQRVCPLKIDKAKTFAYPR